MQIFQHIRCYGAVQCPPHTLTRYEPNVAPFIKGTISSLEVQYILHESSRRME